jgi:fibronectin-binding autotransporter adhesin
LAATAPEPAAAQNWTGNTSTDWTVGSNWSGGAVPAGGIVNILVTAPNPTVLGVGGPATGTISQLFVGRNNGTSGDLTIQNGSILTSSFVRIGELAGSTGVVTVTGAGSGLVINGRIALIVGNLGTGTLNISDNASVITPPLGSFDAAFTAIGNSNTGTLNIANGGTLTSRGSLVVVGNNAGSTGIATVTGAGSMWAVDNTVLNVGLSGGGTLNIQNGGEVVAQQGMLLGGNASSSGTLNLNGGGILDTLSLTAGAGTAQVNFDDGILQARADDANFIAGFSGTELNVAAGGLEVDSAGFDIGTDTTSAFTGAGGLTKTGAGTFTLRANNSYTGATTVNQGTLQAGSTSAFGNNSAVTLADVAGATMDLDGFDNAIGSLAGGGAAGGNVTLGAATLTTGGNNASTTYGGVISGTGGLVKTGTGTQTLVGDSTYTGGTTITAGTLQLGDGGTAGGIVGDVLNNGTLSFNRSNRLAFDGAIAGTGMVRQIGTGLTDLTGDSSGFTGTTSISAGTLAVNGSLCGDVSVLAGGRLQGTGTVCDTSNFAGGTVAPGNSIGTLTVAGNYTGTGGTLEIETVLGDDASPSDRLVVTGDTAGTTDVRVVNLGGGGAQTAEGIKIIDVGGASNGSFTLLGDFTFQGQPAVAAGAYAYVLEQNGLSTPTDGDWYLRSSLTNPESPTVPVPIFQPGVPLFESYAGVLQRFNELDTLQQRVGNRRWRGTAQPAGDGTRVGAPKGIWGRIEATRAKLQPQRSTSGTDYDVTTWKLQFGVDMPLHENEAGRLVGGVAAHYGSVPADVTSIYGVGKIEGVGYGVSGTLTWYGTSGLYVDAQAQVTRHDSDLKSATLGTKLVESNDGYGYALSVEPGYRLALSEHWSLTPQAQLVYARVGFDDFTDPFGARVSLKDGDSLVGRVGLSGDYESTWTDAAGQTSRLHAYAVASVYYDQLDGATVDVSGTRFESEQQSRWGSIGLGGTLDWADGRYSLYGEALVATSLRGSGDSRALSGTLGIRVHW